MPSIQKDIYIQIWRKYLLISPEIVKWEELSPENISPLYFYVTSFKYVSLKQISSTMCWLNNH